MERKLKAWYALCIGSLVGGLFACLAATTGSVGTVMAVGAIGVWLGTLFGLAVLDVVFP
jgi:hypothetical protein